MKNLFFILVFILVSSTLVLAHSEESREVCPMYEQMEEIYGEDMDEMHESMHGSGNNKNLWQRMMFWRWM